MLKDKSLQDALAIAQLLQEELHFKMNEEEREESARSGIAGQRLEMVSSIPGSTLWQNTLS
jgi:hypothetical protein